MRKFLALGIAMLVAAGALTVFVLGGGESDKGCGEAAEEGERAQVGGRARARGAAVQDLGRPYGALRGA